MTAMIRPLPILNNYRPLVPGLAAIGVLLAVAGCHPADKSKDKGPPEVGFAVLQPSSVTLDTELPGRITAIAACAMKK